MEDFYVMKMFLMREELRNWCQPAGVAEWISCFYAGNLRLNLIAAQVSNPSLPALCCLHEGCPESEPAVHTLIQCTPLLGKKAGVAPDSATLPLRKLVSLSGPCSGAWYSLTSLSTVRILDCMLEP